MDSARALKPRRIEADEAAAPPVERTGPSRTEELLDQVRSITSKSKRVVVGMRSVLDSLTSATRETEKGTFLFVEIEKKGQDATEILPGLIANTVEALPWPKSR